MSGEDGAGEKPGSSAARKKATLERRRLVEEGMIAARTYSEIARELKISENQARQHGARIEAAWREEASRGAGAWLDLHLRRLETMASALWPRVVAGDIFAVKALLLILVREARLLGLDKPKSVDLTTGGAPFKLYAGFDPDEV